MAQPRKNARLAAGLAERSSRVLAKSMEVVGHLHGGALSCGKTDEDCARRFALALAAGERASRGLAEMVGHLRSVGAPAPGKKAAPAKKTTPAKKGRR